MSALQGQVALVTGASRGIGRAIAVELGRCGVQVFLNFRRNESAAREAVDAVAAAGGPRPKALQADVADPKECAGLVHTVQGIAGDIDILVHNAGIQRSAMAHKMCAEDWRDVMATNLDAAFFLSRAVLPQMREKGAGQILFIASASAFVSQMGAASYVASKHGLIGLTKALALENAARGVRVNAVAPGLTDTDMVAGLSEAERAGLLDRVPLGRLAEPEEVARTVAWVADQGSYSTGNVFHVTGGVTMG